MSRLKLIITAFWSIFSVSSLGISLRAETELEMFAEEPATASIVKVESPWYAPKFVITNKMRDTIPQYQVLAGLKFKAYSFAHSDGHFGGVYLWKDMEHAAAWFTPSWFERIKRERGVSADVRFFDVWGVLENSFKGVPDMTDSSAVVTLVEIEIPKGVDKKQLVEDFLSSASSYEKIEGLLLKYFITSRHGKFGGIYLWKDEKSAKAWLSEDWLNRTQKLYDHSVTIEWFDAPILLKSTLEVNASNARDDSL